MDVTLIPIGYGNAVAAHRIVALIGPDSSPVKRLREEAMRTGKLVDATHGRRTRAILVMDSDHVVLSAVQPETIAQRCRPGADGEPQTEARTRRRAK